MTGLVGALAALAVLIGVAAAAATARVPGRPDAWTLLVRDGAVVRAGIGVSAWRRPWDQVVRFTSTAQRVRFEAEVVDRDLLGARLVAFALWSVDPERPYLAVQRLGLGGSKNHHLLSRAQYGAFQQAFAALALRHAGRWSHAELARDPGPLLEAIEADARAQLSTLGVQIESFGLLGLEPDAAHAAERTARAVEALRLDAERARLETDRELQQEREAVRLDAERVRLEADRELQQARETLKLRALEAELQRNRQRAEAEAECAEIALATERDKGPELRAHELERLRTERMAEAWGRLPLQEARWVSLNEPLESLRSWLGAA